MCGIAGIAYWRSMGSLIPVAERMAEKILHRGPDDGGAWADAENGIAFGHRRLAIVDLSEHGHQPMASASGRYVIAYNGEVYNFPALREALEREGKAPVWRGHSDTEILLAGFEAWGIEATLKRATGMFAIALWDRQERTLTLARDRIGEKPLYYGWVGDKLLFASELKALEAGADRPLEIDRDALDTMMRFAYIPAPRSIFKNVWKLPAAHRIVFRSANDRDAVPEAYWSLDTPEQTELRRSLVDESDTVLVDRLHDQLKAVIAGQMLSDVPLGAFLSGGVDSSTVVALMQAQSSQPVRTFTIGFNEEAFNEAPYAAAVAKHLGTSHTELYITAKQASDLIPSLPQIYDEPFADSSQIPTTLVSHLTRKHVTVALSGDGGDEMFSGYPRYDITSRLWERIDGQPAVLRRLMACALRAPSPGGWDAMLRLAPQNLRQQVNGRRLHRLAGLITSPSIGELYPRLMSQWQPEDGLVLGASSNGDAPMDVWATSPDLQHAMRRWDLRQYLPDDLLVKVDRAAMSASLESRAPLLDHHIAELAFAMPNRVLQRDGVGKWVLRRVLDRYVPRELIDRPKTGFSIPLGEWLRGPLREWAESLLATSQLRAQGYLDATKVERTWQQHLSGSYDRSPYLWNVLMFQAWLANR
ncbi:asparagine synthase (glutamine-hydrolyzing) [Pandoraea vervacti]|uniref:asparagine synthase (glutamine-hydrolyzing) n=1 Tax=Pandoraea vervacti TaxID=656178 RepID=A0ABM5T2L8_9BURK|nr:asparagine synthase (glutamine-hydrolyzing) [Pandoraea vervacti]AJP59109.1 asparagine synthase (glutamine-hydrolyzing) [Pandoraea vervacti]